MKQGMALVFLSPVRGETWVRLIETTDPENCLTHTYRAVVEFPDVTNLHDVVDNHLLFRKPKPLEWYALRDIDLSKERPHTSGVWNPTLPENKEVPEIIFYTLGEYTTDDVHYVVVGIAPYHVDVCLRNPKTLLGTPTPLEVMCSDETLTVASVLRDAWKRLEL